MATVKPFKCVRPNPDVAEKVAALPYDVYSRAEAKEKVKGDNLTFLRIDRAETQFDDSVGTYDDCVYAKARQMLDDDIANGVYIRDEEECYYIYELIMNGRHQTGIVACASINDYLSNVIKKHENTREDKLQDRIRHVDTCSAQTGPIFLAYRSNKVISEAVNSTKNGTKPIYSFTSEDGITHNVWKLDDKEKVEAVRAQFENTGSIYIADGHHRCASAVKVGLKRRQENPNYTGEEEFNYFLSVLFPEDQLLIMPYNRVVRDLVGLSVENFLSRIRVNFHIHEVEGPFEPKEKATYGMYLDGKWYEIAARNNLRSISDPVASLDVSLLQDYLLGPILGIGDPRTDKRIDFIGGIRGLSELERRCASGMRVAFSMYPTSIQELFAVADAGRLMPPKSTWFEPKLRSGLFIHQI
ncbi:MAG: DUF1015 domain-containing protein [Lachnospiraceae bacterium]|nr:DUF1015 domain-containing protein [Lachnospiraceae bacterium]MBO4559898.1 DUF1015 domain-containing protein [Lachnospiraceae bacterium]